MFGERRWNDFKTKGHLFKKGNFTSEEIKTLMNALCSYVQKNHETSEDSSALDTLTILCSRSKHELP